MNITLNNKSETAKKFKFPCIIEWPHTRSVYWMIDENNGIYLGKAEGREDASTKVGTLFTDITLQKDTKVYHGTITLSND